MSSTSSRRALRAVVVIATALVTLVGGLLMATPAQAQKIYPSYFGIHGSGAIGRMSLGSIRLWDSGTSWRDIETSNGVYGGLPKLKNMVNTARSRGLRPMVVLGQTPTFHVADPSRANPTDAYGTGAASMPDLGAWSRYVSAVAKELGNSVDYQVWNEPNVVNYWRGSVQGMADLTRVAHDAIKANAGRSAVVVAPSFPLRLWGQQDWYKKYWSARSAGRPMASYVDVVSVNLYPLANQGPESMLPLIRFAKAHLPTAARSKPMWNTEINYGLRGGPAATRISSGLQAAYVARTMLLNAASPVRRVYWYAWNVGPIANTQINSGTNLTPAGRAWGVTRGWLLGANVTKCARTAKGKYKGLYTCTARRSRTEIRRFYWKPTGKAIRIKTHKTTKSWTALSGRKTDPRRTRSYAIKVGKTPIMVTSRR